ncbi:MAG: spore maturation protein [Firmicutes bacterium]|nr:spore maturation protein [Bacillota bacterium]
MGQTYNISMNIVFLAIILVSLILLLINDPSLLIPALTNSSTNAVEFTLKLLAIYAIWMGILKLCDKTGVSSGLAKLLRPIIKFLFGDIKDETVRLLSINMSANILGMGNAATPAAISAIETMDEGKTVASYAMIMLVVINATSLQLLPTSVISLRQAYGSVNAADIILPSILSSLCSTIFGVVCVMLLYRKSMKKLKAQRERVLEYKSESQGSKIKLKTKR